MSKISIITTLYHSSEYINEFYHRIVSTINKIGEVDYEIIFVNDYSPDDSLVKVIKLREQSEKVKIIDLSKNYGQHIAILCGLENSTGDYIVVLDIDLEEKPELIEELYNKIISSKSDIVYGIRKDAEKVGIMQLFFRKIFWFIFGIISDFNVKKNISNIRIFNRNFCNALISHKERGWILSVMTQICGFRQETLLIDRIYKGKTSYNFKRRLKFFLSHILNYSNKPLYLSVYLGFLMASISFIIGIVIIIRKIFFNTVVTGWSSIMVSIWFVGGAILFSLGVIGTYIANIFIDVKQRPIYIIKNTYGFKNDI